MPAGESATDYPDKHRLNSNLMFNCVNQSNLWFFLVDSAMKKSFAGSDFEAGLYFIPFYLIALKSDFFWCRIMRLLSGGHNSALTMKV